MGEGQKDIKNHTLWVLIEERDSIKNIQLAVFGAAIGFMVSFIAKDFIVDSLFCRSILDIIPSVLHFSVTLFFYIAVGYISHRGNIKHIYRNIQNENTQGNHLLTIIYMARRFLIMFSFYIIISILFIINSIPFFYEYVAKLVFATKEIREKSFVFTIVTAAIFITWFATSYWINIAFRDPMDELPPPGKFEKNASKPP